MDQRSIFISYSSADKAVADQICSTLEAAGYPCWIAPRDIEPGADYPVAILEGLQHARGVVAVISTSAVTSPHILTEVEHAFVEKKPIIPFRLSEAPLPPSFDYFLATSQWLDAKDGCTPENLGRLKEAVSQALAGRAAAVSEKKSRTRRSWIVAAGIAVVLAIAAIAWWRPTTAPKQAAETRVVPTVADHKPSAEVGKPQPWVNPKNALAYVWIPPGTFTMGCSPGDTECKPDESPSHMVELPAGFWLGQTEVTNAAYARILKSFHYPANEDKLPVVGLSWREAKDYCAASGGRLPTEAEWEYAARGGTAGAWYGVPARIAWFAATSEGRPHEVATRDPNAYGLYDMLGNSAEWVQDRYYNKYDVDAPAIGAVEQPLAGNASAVLRGGYWDSDMANIRASRRAAIDGGDAVPMAGVRCVAVH